MATKPSLQVCDDRCTTQPGGKFVTFPPSWQTGRRPGRRHQVRRMHLEYVWRHKSGQILPPLQCHGDGTSNATPGPSRPLLYKVAYFECDFISDSNSDPDSSLEARFDSNSDVNSDSSADAGSDAGASASTGTDARLKRRRRRLLRPHQRRRRQQQRRHPRRHRRRRQHRRHAAAHRLTARLIVVRWHWPQRLRLRLHQRQRLHQRRRQPLR